MMDDTQGIINVNATQAIKYHTDLAIGGEAANRASQQNAFQDYQSKITPNTKRRQKNDLEAFSLYLSKAGINRSVEDMMHDPLAWKGMTYGLLRGFVVWSLQEGYSTGTINVRLSTIRQYCKLVGPEPYGAGVISEQDLAAIFTVRGYDGKQARNIDHDREYNGIPTRKSTKKSEATIVNTTQALTLKKTTIDNKKVRQRDQINAARDALMMGLFIEHALRVSEIAALNVEHIDIAAGLITIYRQKTNQTDTHLLKQHTRIAAEIYLEKIGRTEGPLFDGYQGKRLSVNAINVRVRELGQQIGIKKLSPHDLRHFWAFDALRNGTPIDQVKSGGGWKSDSMVLRYAKRSGIANAGVKITEEVL
ncbi:MAG TPA: tyrosine-type recombinase/integrase [Ktedonobacteraceae bacterium]|jgi:integrase